MSNMKKMLCVAAAYVFMTGSVYAESFVVKKIEIDGLSGMSRSTVLNYLPVKEGDSFNAEQTPAIIKDLYKTGFFSDVDVTSDHDVIRIKVVEREIIASINVSGNKKVTKKQLLEVLKDIGLTEGRVLNQSSLNGLEQILLQQYHNMGNYDVSVKTSISKAPRNRVVLNVKIEEGPSATIKELHIVGAKAFSEKKLLSKNFTLTTPKWWKFTFLTHNDQYTKEKLDADLEKLRAYYMDRGYLKFKIDSTQVSLTPDKKYNSILINITEGEIYKVSGFSLGGTLLGKEKEARNCVQLERNEIFSRQKIMDVNEAIHQLYGNYGYANTDIRTEPVIDDEKHQVFIKFSVEPGKKVYVRRINFIGNHKTDEEVMRREMRQQEGALYSFSKINESKRRLANFAYVENVDAKLEPVPNHPDQVDLNYNVKETSSASATFQLGYSTVDGLVYGIHVDETNFMGTGRLVSVQFNNSSAYQSYGFSYYNPYHTINNIGLKFDAYAQMTNAAHANISTYNMDLYGSTITYVVPLSDYTRLNAGYGYEYTHIKTTSASPTQVTDFVKKYGGNFNDAKLLAGWSYNKFDRAIFPTDGFAQSVNLEGGVPVDRNKLSYYKTSYNASWYKPVYKKIIFHTKGEAGYGRGIGTIRDLPFFKNYYAGGMDSVRGFDGNSLGPRDSNGDPLGGNVLADASASLIFPNPLGDSLRTSVFVDVGNVGNNKLPIRDLRSAAGAQVEWRSPIGVLRFAVTPFYLHSLPKDRKRFFDFSFGTSF